MPSKQEVISNQVGGVRWQIKLIDSEALTKVPRWQRLINNADSATTQLILFKEATQKDEVVILN